MTIKERAILVALRLFALQYWAARDNQEASARIHFPAFSKLNSASPSFDTSMPCFRSWEPKTSKMSCTDSVCIRLLSLFLGDHSFITSHGAFVQCLAQTLNRLRTF